MKIISGHLSFINELYYSYNHDMPVFAWALFWKTIGILWQSFWGILGVVYYKPAVEFWSDYRHWNRSWKGGENLHNARLLPSQNWGHPEVTVLFTWNCWETCRLKLLPLHGELLYYRLNRTPLFVRLSYLAAAVQMFLYPLCLHCEFNKRSWPKEHIWKTRNGSIFPICSTQGSIVAPAG